MTPPVIDPQETVDELHIVPRAEDLAYHGLTRQEVADFVQELGDDADNDGVLLSGDLHPASVNRLLGDLVPELRARGVLRREYGNGGLRANLFDF